MAPLTTEEIPTPLYETTVGGGDPNLGKVFEVSPHGSGGWIETKMHNFFLVRGDGANPYCGLLFDRNAISMAPHSAEASTVGEQCLK